MKNKNKIAILMVSCIAVLAVILFTCSFVMLKKAEKAKADAEAAAKEVLNEAMEETEKTEETEMPDATVTPEQTAEVFEEVNDNVFIIVAEANLRKEPSMEGEVLETAPMSRLLKRTGIGAEWSRLEVNGQECYVSNELISTEMPDAAVNGDLLEPGVGDSGVNTASTGKTVVIDPGHQGHGDSTQEPIGPGASSTKARVTSGTSGCVSGWDEYELNLEVSLQLRDELASRGYTVYMTRETHDINISNKERAAFASAHNGDILVRIHANGSESSSVSGALTMAPSNGNPFLSAELISESQRLSQCVIDAYVSATGFNNQGVYQTDEMSGINWSTMPVTIVEMGYMSNPSDDAAMADPAMQVKIVDGISNGIDAYFAGGN